jgi:hypothetical protein
MAPEERKNLLDQCPFLTLLTYVNRDYLGIIQNSDDTVISFYDFESVAADQRLTYLELGETWWWSSNRQIPINLFLKTDWAVFKPTLKTLNSKSVNIVQGPYVSLKESSSQKSKRRSVILVRRIT